MFQETMTTYLILHIPLSIFFSWQKDRAAYHKNIRELLGQVPTIDLEKIPESSIIVQVLGHDVGQVECVIHGLLNRDKKFANVM